MHKINASFWLFLLSYYVVTFQKHCHSGVCCHNMSIPLTFKAFTMTQPNFKVILAENKKVTRIKTFYGWIVFEEQELSSSLNFSLLCFIR